MTAKTTWFYCGKCGFKNHPRPAAAPVYVQADDGRFDLVEGSLLCEQCGTENTHPASVDYTPAGG
jgi:hypothetical protein